MTDHDANPPDHPSSPADAIDDKVVDATLNAYYPAVVASVDTARARAQTAYTISSATAGALVAAGALAHITNYAVWVQFFGALSLLAWVVAAALFVTVSRDVDDQSRAKVAMQNTGREGKLRPSSEPELLSASEFVVKALQAARRKAHVIDLRLSRAVFAVWMALTLTVVTFSLALALPAHGPVRSVEINLTTTGTQTLQQACGGISRSTVTGKLDVNSLKDKQVVVELPAGECGAEEEIIVLPSEDVQTVEQHRGTFPFFP